MFNLLLAEQSYNSGALWLGAIAILAVIVFVAIFCDNKKYKLDTRCIATAGICVALSFVLSFIKLFSMPQGGSVTLASLLPILLFAYIYGPRKGAVVGAILGVLNFIADPWFVHPGQFLLDYVLAFSAIGLAGMFGKVKIFDKYKQIGFGIGTALALTIRFVSHLISGCFAFYTYATTEIWAYSAAYNSFVFIDGLICLIIGVAILSSPQIVKAIYPKESLKNNSENINDKK